ncbi:MAG: response regulator [Chloroflexi bacterium]|nr:response regulator [Chloroflexota bacterium]
MSTYDIKRSVLVVDDEEPLRSAICEYLSTAGYDVVDAHSGADAICKIVHENFDVIISDVRMPELSGFDLIHVIDKLCDNTIVILLTAVPDPDGNLTELAREAGVYAYLSKPCKLKTLKDTLEQAFADKAAASDFLQASIEPAPEYSSDTQQTDVEPESSQVCPKEEEKEDEDNCETIDSEQSSSATASNKKTSRPSHVSLAIESIITDPNQTPLQDKDEVTLSLKRYSHHYGDLKLNANAAIKREIEDLVLNPGGDIRELSPQSYVTSLSEDFISKGWEPGVSISIIKDEMVQPLDFIKDGIGIKFGFQSTTLRMVLTNMQKAYKSKEFSLDVCILVIQTGSSQKYLVKKTGKHWSGASFDEAVRTLKNIQRQLDVPICILGLDIGGSIEGYAVEAASYARNAIQDFSEDSTGNIIKKQYNLGEMSSTQIKQSVLDYLEHKYDRTIERNVKVQGRDGLMGVDGLIRLGADVILEIEMTKNIGSSHAVALSSISDDLAKPLKDYQRITGRKTVLRYVLLGGFTSGYLRDLDWQIDNAYITDNKLIIDYELLSFEEVGIRTHDGMKSVRVPD